jgi:hypothetical protein
MSQQTTPPPCDSNIYENGTPIFMTCSIPSAQLEQWVKQVAELSQQPVDWHFAGGRAVIRTTGEIGAVRLAICRLLPEHDTLQKKAILGLTRSRDIHNYLGPNRRFLVGEDNL